MAAGAGTAVGAVAPDPVPGKVGATTGTNAGGAAVAAGAATGGGRREIRVKLLEPSLPGALLQWPRGSGNTHGVCTEAVARTGKGRGLYCRNKPPAFVRGNNTGALDILALSVWGHMGGDTCVRFTRGSTTWRGCVRSPDHTRPHHRSVDDHPHVLGTNGAADKRGLPRVTQPHEWRVRVHACMHA